VNQGTCSVVEDLNSALAGLLAEDESLFLLGEDIASPYGGAFKATRGLSDLFPDRVISTPISEQAMMGVANGLALSGNRVIVELMFSDFALLTFDQLVNVSSKSVDMYGRRLPMHVVVRCPSGGYRGYGPTHSQSLQKYFIGIPHLQVFEASAFHSARDVLAHMLDLGLPCVYFEEKVLYPQPLAADGSDHGFFQRRTVGEAPGTVEFTSGAPEDADCVLICPGGMAGQVLGAAEQLLLRDEVATAVYVPSRLHPFDLDAVAQTVSSVGRVCVVDQGSAGGTWAEAVAHRLHTELWGSLKQPVRVVNSLASAIPAAVHLEREVLVQQQWIIEAVREVLGG